jgi:exopolysaccharide biosynthesis polyprenyl glycosylphosphotransferase
MYRRLLITADATAAVASLELAAVLTSRSLTWWLLLPAMFAVIFAKIQGLYDRDDLVIQKSTVAEWRTIFQAAAMTAVGTYLSWRVVTNSSKGGGVRLLIFLALSTFALDLIGRVLARALARRVTPDERIVIIGNPHQCVQLARNLSELRGIDLIGTIPYSGMDGLAADELGLIVNHLHSHRLVIVTDHSRPEVATLELIRSAKSLGVRVSLMPTVMAVVGGRAVFDDVHGLTLLGVPRFGLSQSSWALKRAFDLVGAGIGTLVAVPLFAALAVAIKLDSPGPVLFRQTRVGRDGRHFKILKLRTMVDGADSMKAALLAQNEASAGLFKMADDPRITRIGKRLRAMHVDELPQLINVLRGDMSLVGPRPLVIEEDTELLRSSERLPLTPGITGPWQIRGPMNASLPEMARLDYLYISSWTIWRDVDILIRTALRIVARSGH